MSTLMGLNSTQLKAMALHRSATVLLLLLIPAIFGLLARPCKADNVLYSGETLSTDQQLSSGNYFFIMQYDCNLVLYDLDKPIWHSSTYKKGTYCYAKMQNDGNFVIYSGTGNSIWATNTQLGPGNYVLVLQRDRNVVIYGTSRWSTKTYTLTGNFSASAEANITTAELNTTTAELNEGKIAMVINQ